MIREYFNLTKPGIIKGNLIATIAGFLFASHGAYDFLLFLATVTGISLVIASGCVFNNYIDRNIDKKMTRTKNRALVSGKISGRSALLYASILGVLGFASLWWVNVVTLLVAFVGFVFYVVIYGYFKRNSVHGTLVGSISGAVPPVVGYTAVAGVVDGAAVLLFLFLVCWQMPHFYAISIYRKSDYESAGLPVMSVSRGIDEARKHIVAYIVLLLGVVSLFTLFGYTSYIFLVIMLGVIGYWLLISGRRQASSEHWAGKMFGFSLTALLVFCIALSIDHYIPF